MKREDLEEWLNTKWLGRNLQMMEETDSTNQRAKTAAATGEQEGLVIVAEQQTSGRGRRGRGWISPPGENIYMTMLLRPAFDPGRAPMLTLLAACAAARAAMEPGHESPRIKWPNDLVIGGKKIVGILTEMGMKKSRPDYVIIGVGINCNQTTFSGGLEQKATSLKKEYGHDVCREKVIARFLNEFEELYEGFVQYGSLAFVKQAYEKLLVNRGERVRVLEPGREWTGRALGITDTGELIVEAEDGEIREVSSGEVSVRGVYGYV